jgi:hypothetical protein
LNERIRMAIAIVEAMALGHGGMTLASKATGVSRRAITGATGFIGEHLLNQLVRRKGIELRVLIHEKTNKNIMSRSNIKTIEGDLL